MPNRLKCQWETRAAVNTDTCLVKPDLLLAMWESLIPAERLRTELWVNSQSGIDELRRIFVVDDTVSTLNLSPFGGVSIETSPYIPAGRAMLVENGNVTGIFDLNGFVPMAPAATPVDCFCRSTENALEKEPGCHHAVTCLHYRSDTQGPDAAFWSRKWKQLSQARQANRQAGEGATDPYEMEA